MTRLAPAVSTLLTLFLVAAPRAGHAQQPDSVAQALKSLSLEQLMNVDVTSVSKRPEPLSKTASAIQVITSEDIRRSGARTLAEALRLAPNLQVAQVNASQWAISARGFNNVLANKLLVLIDGRTVYTPLYAGVFWDVQNPPLEAIDRIEVISGPGGALWGSNAVNGVINVITKPVALTEGPYASISRGTDVRGMASARYGVPLGTRATGRVYGEALSFGSTILPSDTATGDDWHMFQVGARIDWKAGEASDITFQGDMYSGRPDPDGNAPVAALGGNIMGRWSHTLSERSDFELQLYYDRTFRDLGNGFTEALDTYDADFHHRLELGTSHRLVWGLGARFLNHATQNLEGFRFEPTPRLLHLYSVFAQDEIAVVPDRLRFTLGARVERNDYTGVEIQPNARLAWSPAGQHTIWGAVSRAVRTPARIDRDFELDAAPGVPIIVPYDFDSETLVAYELGWRIEATPHWSFSLSAFHHEYDNLRSVHPDTISGGLPFTFRNDVRGHGDGIEIASTHQIGDRWRLRAGYTFLSKRLEVKPGAIDLNGASAEANDPPHQVVIQSSVDLPGRLEWDVVLRYADALPNPPVASYVDLDIRLGWNIIAGLELAITGENLLDDGRVEFVPSPPQYRRYPRGMTVSLSWR